MGGVPAGGCPPQATAYGATPLHFAALGSARAIGALVAAGANPRLQDKAGNTPLQLAQATNNAQTVSSLTDALAETELRKLA